MTDASVIESANMQPDRKSETRACLAQAAVKVFETRGFHAARVSDIAEAAGYAKGTFYLYFQNKESVFHYLIDGFFDRLLTGTLARFPAGAVADRDELTAQLGEMWGEILAFCRANPALTTLVLRDSSAIGPDARDRVEVHFATVAGAIGGYFADLAARGLVRDGIGAATGWAVLGMIERAIHYALTVAPDAPANVLAVEFLALELSGLGLGPPGA